MRTKHAPRPDVLGCLAALVLALVPAGARAAAPEAEKAPETEGAPAPAELAERMDALARRMASDSYAEREKASAEVAKLPSAAAPLLRKLAGAHEDPEVRWRCEEALDAIQWNQFVAGNQLIDYAGNEDIRKALQQEINLPRGNNSYHMLNSWLMQRKPACMLSPQGLGMRALVRQPIFPAGRAQKMKGEDLLIKLLTASRTRARVGKPQNIGRMKRFPILIHAFEESAKDAAKPAQEMPGQVLQLQRQGGVQIQVNQAGGFVIRAGVNAGGGGAAAVKVEKVEKPEKKEEKTEKPGKPGSAPAAGGASGGKKEEEKEEKKGQPAAG